MKIGLVTPYIFPLPGGVNAHVGYLYENLVKRGHDVRIISATHSDLAGMVERGELELTSAVQYSIEETMRNAARFVTEAKVDGVKFEATHNHIAKTKAVVEMGIACVGHVGLHPQAVGALGGLKAQGTPGIAARWASVIVPNVLSDNCPIAC